MSDTQHAHTDAALEIAALIELLEERAARASKPLPENAGKPYCPATGSEGRAFLEAFCDRCIYSGADANKNGCPIAEQAYIVADARDPECPNQWVYDDDGVPSCRMFVSGEPVRKLCGGALTPEQEREAFEKAKRGEL